MIITVTRKDTHAGISTVVGSVDTRILTEGARIELREELAVLARNRCHIGDRMVRYDVEVLDDSGASHHYFACHDPNSPWCDQIRKLLNKAGMTDRI